MAFEGTTIQRQTVHRGAGSSHSSGRDPCGTLITLEADLAEGLVTGMGAPSHLAPEVMSTLVDIVGSDHVIVDADMRVSYEVDWTGRFRGSTPVVVRPASTGELAAILCRCDREGIAVVPQGGNTGLVGGSVPLAGEVVVTLSRLDQLDAVDICAAQVTAGAGVTLGAVQLAARSAGLDYAVDLAARDKATLGGTVATNAGGLHFVRYGGTRQQLLGVEAVLADGRVISHLGGLPRDNTGYDLASLLCGSEGTLAVITAARLRLVPRQPRIVVALVAFESVGSAVEAVGSWMPRLTSLDAAELMLAGGLQLVCDVFGFRHPFPRSWPVYLLFEASAEHDPSEELADLVNREPSVRDVAVATDRSRASELWRYREEHTAAINSLGPPRKLDIAVPFRHIAEFVETVPEVVRDVDPCASTWLFGHIGDGNIHVNVTRAVGQSATRGSRSGCDVDAMVDGIDGAVFDYVASLGGSISAEHGIGTYKRKWLHLNRSPVELDVFRAIKRSFDPNGILNPNVLLTPPA